MCGWIDKLESKVAIIWAGSREGVISPDIVPSEAEVSNAPTSNVKRITLAASNKVAGNIDAAVY